MISSAPSIPTTSPFSPLDPASESLVLITALHRLLQLQKYMWLTSQERLAFEAVDGIFRDARAALNCQTVTLVELEQIFDAVQAHFGSIVEFVGDGFSGLVVAAVLDTLEGLCIDGPRPSFVRDNLWYMYSIVIRNMSGQLVDSVADYFHLLQFIESAEQLLLIEIEQAVVQHGSAAPSVIGDRFALSFAEEYRNAMSLISGEHRGQRRTQA